MLDEVTAYVFRKALFSGKTQPYVLECERSTGERVEVVVKLKKRCETIFSQSAEIIASLLALDLDLPVPEPFLVNIGSTFASSIDNLVHRTALLENLGLNFGCHLMSPGFAIATDNMKLDSRETKQIAADILAFDTFIANPDRRIDNPNLLWNGRQFAMIDHELSLWFKGLLFWRPPWEPGGIKNDQLRLHILYNSIKRNKIDYSRLRDAFGTITEKRLNEYGQALPDDWVGDGEQITDVLEYLKKLVDNSARSLENLAGAIKP